MDEMLDDDKAQRVARVCFGPRPVPIWTMLSVFSKLPSDTVMIRHMEDPKTAQWGWVVASKSFQKVNEGDTLPVIQVKIDGVGKSVDLITPINPENFLNELDSL